MAETTISEDIAELEEELTAIKQQIKEQQQYKSIEEGSSQSKFKTEFTPINELYAERNAIKTRLRVLYGATK